MFYKRKHITRNMKTGTMILFCVTVYLSVIESRQIGVQDMIIFKENDGSKDLLFGKQLLNVKGRTTEKVSPADIISLEMPDRFMLDGGDCATGFVKFGDTCLEED